MEAGLLSVLALGFILGLKHALEPDHIIAVSTIAAQSKKLIRSAMAGVFWGIGHTATLFITGMAMIFMKGEIPEKWTMTLEFCVGIMLVYLGISSMISFKNVHVHKEHQDGGELICVHSHSHRGGHQHTNRSQHAYFNTKSTIVGLVHGLAGSAAMVLLTMSTVDSAWEGALYILVFGAGTVAGMLFFTTIIGIPFVLSAGKAKLNRGLAWVAGAVSTAFGIYYMYNLGFTEGLFNLWFQV